MKMSVTADGSTPASASDAGNWPAPGPKAPPAPVSNSSTLSPDFTSSGSMVSEILSGGRPLALSTAATSSGLRPTPNVLLSLGPSMPPSRNATADNSPILNACAFSGFGAGGGASATGGGGASAGAGASAGFEHAASVAAANKARHIRRRVGRSMESSWIWGGRILGCQERQIKFDA